MSQDQYLGKYVAIRTAQGYLIGVGLCISYTDRPTIEVNTPDGKQVNWIADLCEVLPLKAYIEHLESQLKPKPGSSSISTEPDAQQLMRFINYLCGGSAHGMLAYAKWAKGQR